MSRRFVDAVVIHGTWTKAGRDPDIAEIRHWHMTKPDPYDDVGYHLLWTRGGRELWGRPLEREGAHCKPDRLNWRSIGVVMNGGMAADGQSWDVNYTRAQFARLADLPATIERWRTDPAIAARIEFAREVAIIGHRDGDPRRQCPGMDVPAFFDPRWRRAASIEERAA